MYKLFVYGILKDMFEGRETSIIAECYDLGAYPAITKLGSGWRVQGKVIEVDADTLKELDIIEGVAYDLYTRKLYEVDGEYVQIYVYKNKVIGRPKCSNFINNIN